MLVHLIVLLYFAAKDVTYICPFSGPKRGNLSVTNFKIFFKQTDNVCIVHILPVCILTLIQLLCTLCLRKRADFAFAHNIHQPIFIVFGRLTLQEICKRMIWEQVQSERHAENDIKSHASHLSYLKTPYSPHYNRRKLNLTEKYDFKGKPIQLKQRSCVVNSYRASA